MAYAKTENGSVQFYKAMEAHVLANKDEMNGQELANVIYSYHKMETAAPNILEMLIPTVFNNIHKFKPRELTSILMAYSEEGFFDTPK
jgi:hypothetical protein